MKNKITAVILFAVCLVINCCAVSAEQHSISYIKSLDGDMVKISGTVENGAGSEIFIRVDYPGSGFGGETSELEKYVIYQEQKTIDAEDGFEFSVKLKDIGEEEYTLRLGVMGDDNDISEEFIFYGESYRNTALAAIVDAQSKKDADAFVAALDTYYANLYLNTPVFDAYYAGYPELENIKNALVNSPEITSVEQLEETLECTVITNELKKCTSPAQMEAALRRFDSALNISGTTMYQTYSNMSENAKKKVLDSFTGKNYTSREEIREAFFLSVLNNYLSEAVGASAVKSFLSDNSAMLGINTAGYDLPDSAYLQLTGGGFTSLSDVKKRLDDLKSAADKNKNQGSAGGGGGGGGGASGTRSGGSSVAPVVGETGTGDAQPSDAYPFDDMEDYVWAKAEAKSLYEKGILHGYGNRMFGPSKLITREEFLKLIINGFAVTAEADGEIYFDDVGADKWYYPFIKTGVNSSLVNGIGNNLFGVGKNITRQDLTVMIYRAVRMKTAVEEANGKSAFEDFESVADYAKEAVLFAEINGIVKGMGDGNFHPERNAGRAEAAVILYRALEYLNN